MARVLITPVSIPDASSNGYNLTDSADFTTLATGAGNGVEFVYDRNLLILLKNSTAGAAIYTLVARTIGSLTTQGGSVTNPTITVAAGDTQLMRPYDIFKQSDGKMYIDCDVAAEIMVLSV